MHTKYYGIVLLAMFIALAGCSSTQPLSAASGSHRYFLEINRPGSVYSILENPKYRGGLVQLVEINDNGQAGDTLNTWVQHFNGRKKMAEEALSADMIIACYREDMKLTHQKMHVLPESTGKIYVYMMQGGVLAVSDEKISFYDVLLAVRNNNAVHANTP